MRVVCLSSYAFADYTIRLANALSDIGETVMLVLPQSIPPEQVNSVHDEVSLYLFSQQKPGVSKYPWKNLSFIMDIIKSIKRFNADIIHIQGTHFWVSLAAFMSWRYPLVTTFHDVKPHLGEEKLSRRATMYWARKHSKRIFVHGRKLQELMVKEFGVPVSKVKPIPFGEHYDSPLKDYEKENIEEEGNLILFFGRIYEYKGLEYLIKAESSIIREVPGAKIIIAGEGEDFQKYKNMMQNEDNYLIYNYFVESWKSAELFQRCSVVVLPYIEASQSGVAVTAYGFKKPVIVTDVGSIPEIVDDGVTGLIVPPRDSELLAKAIIRLLKDEKLRKEMGENAYRKLKEELSWDNIARITIDVYREALEVKDGGKAK